MRIVKADTIDKAKKIIFDEENVRIDQCFPNYDFRLPNKYWYLYCKNDRIASYNTETKEMVIY